MRKHVISGLLALLFLLALPLPAAAPWREFLE